jgi:hypothetical protein
MLAKLANFTEADFSTTCCCHDLSAKVVDVEVEVLAAASNVMAVAVKILVVVDEVVAGVPTAKVVATAAKALTVTTWYPPPPCPPWWRTLSFTFSFAYLFFTFFSDVQDKAADLAASE